MCVLLCVCACVRACGRKSDCLSTYSLYVLRAPGRKSCFLEVVYYNCPQNFVIALSFEGEVKCFCQIFWYHLYNNLPISSADIFFCLFAIWNFSTNKILLSKEAGWWFFVFFCCFFFAYLDLLLSVSAVQLVPPVLFFQIVMFMPFRQSISMSHILILTGIGIFWWFKSRSRRKFPLLRCVIK